MRKDRLVKLAIDVAAVADADNVNYTFLRVNFINYAVVTITQAITTLFIPFQRLALERRVRKGIYGGNNVFANIAM